MKISVERDDDSQYWPKKSSLTTPVEQKNKEINTVIDQNINQSLSKSLRRDFLLGQVQSNAKALQESKKGI